MSRPLIEVSGRAAEIKADLDRGVCSIETARELFAGLEVTHQVASGNFLKLIEKEMHIQRLLTELWVARGGIPEPNSEGRTP